ncbi:unnamed protein product [marine sediment metagenome]|uniref:Sister chromatid cohesion C-terminal domain-containing protein n=1 Tax=marine sediment metagenome TaxID=412755 RepID=X1G483_9ZZZZ
MALRAVADVHSKHPDFVYSSLLPGLRLASTFLRTVLCRSSALLPSVEGQEPLSLFAGMYSQLLHTNRTLRNRFFGQLLALFTATPRANDGCQAQLLRFVAEMLAHLPFTLLEEPLHVVYLINRHVNLHGAALADSQRSLFRALHISVAAAEGEEWEEGVEKAAAAGEPEDFPAAEDRTVEQLLQKLHNLCHGSFATACLLHVKHHLKAAYQVCTRAGCRRMCCACPHHASLVLCACLPPLFSPRACLRACAYGCS